MNEVFEKLDRFKIALVVITEEPEIRNLTRDALALVESSKGLRVAQD